MTKRPAIISLGILCLILTAGCGGEQDASSPVAKESPPTETSNEPPETATLSEGFATPESVLHDPEEDVYYISNIGGNPLDADDDGYITRMNAASRTTNSEWIDGDEEEIELNAPKGMAIVGDELWVADINQIRRFARSNGQPLGSIPVAGATFLNDLVTGTDGSVYASDTGMRAGTAGFEPTGTDAIYRISEKGDVETIASGSELNGPNGLLMLGADLWVVTFRSNELYRLVDGKKTDVVTLPAGGLDGIGRAADGSLLISSWEGRAVYRGQPSGPFVPMMVNVTSPADLGIDSERNLILVPLFEENRLEIRPLDSVDPTATSEATTETAVE